MDDKIYAYTLNDDGTPGRCFIASNDEGIPEEFVYRRKGDNLPSHCTIEGGEVIVPVVEVWNDVGNDAWNWANDSLGNDYGHVHSGSESNGYSYLGNDAGNNA